MRRSAFIHSQQIEKYHYPEDSPFKTERAGRTRQVLHAMGLLHGPNIREVAPKPADRRTLKKFHTARYLHALKQAEKGQWDLEALRMGLGTTDCPIFRGMTNYAVLAAGATLVGAGLLLSGEADVAFNPSGGYHHAFPEKAAGFCYINDNALACTVLAEAGKRVLYLDVDVHCGDGVAYAFYERSDVMTISLHENPKLLFPGTGFEDEIGQGQGRGYCVNLPLPAGAFDQAYLYAFDSIAVPLIRAYKPDVIVFELGADTLAGDPLAHLHLTNNTYADIIGRLLRFNRPILMTGGGGYNVENTVRAWALAWSVLSDQDTGQGMEAAIGGVMLQSTDWQGGLRDRELPVTDQQRTTVLSALDASIDIIKATVFPIHGL
ncbi:MAG: acetoin utilization protein AcuC [Sedimentisphaerales bacterium]|nr:acetoin utilization protein AcuC [Sedimentisphaerales bacterium]